MNAMKIEEKSTHAIRETFLHMDCISVEVASGDKTISYDGHIGMYGKSDGSKAGYRKIAIQVKGKKGENVAKHEMSYPVSIEDLKIYLANEPCIYFVVVIANKKSKIYYNAFTPVKLKKILEGVKPGQRTKSIKFRQFPDSEDKVLIMLNNFYTDCRKQRGFVDKKLLALKDLGTEKVRLCGTLHLRGKRMDMDTVADSFLGSEIYPYMKEQVRGMDIDIPLMNCGLIRKIEWDLNQKISVDGVVYYDKISIEKVQGSKVLRIADVVEIKCGDGENCITLTGRAPAKLMSRIYGFKFLIAIGKSGKLTLGETKLEGIRLEESYIAALEKNLKVLEDVRDTMSLLRVKDDLDIGKLTPEEDFEITNLTGALKNGVEYKISGKQCENPVIINIQNHVVAIFVFQNVNDDGKVICTDLLDERVLVRLENHSGEFPGIFLLDRSILAQLTNLDGSSLIEHVEAFKERCSDLYVASTFILLEMIHAYDLSGRKDILNNALEFAEWIYQSDGQQEVLNFLNIAQIKFRGGTIDEEIKDKIQDILNQNLDTEINCCCHVLLGEYMCACKCLGDMSINAKRMFMDYPIYRLLELSGTMKPDE